VVRGPVIHGRRVIAATVVALLAVVGVVDGGAPRPARDNLRSPVEVLDRLLAEVGREFLPNGSRA
jgi:hypothetical protein